MRPARHQRCDLLQMEGQVRRPWGDWGQAASDGGGGL